MFQEYFKRLKEQYPDLNHIGYDDIDVYLVFNDNTMMCINEFITGSDTKNMLIEIENILFKTKWKKKTIN